MAIKHLSDEQIQKFRERSLKTAQEFYAVDDHLAECEQCRAHFNLLEDVMKLKQSLTGELSEDLEHLEFEQMASWLDGTVDPKQRGAVSEHLERCSICSREVEELRAFSETMAGSAETKTEKILPFRKRTFSRFWVVATSIAATVAIAATIALMWYQNRVDHLQARLKDAQTQNERLRQAWNQQNPPSIKFQDGPAQVRIEKDGQITVGLVISEKEQQIIRDAVINQKFNLPSDVSKLIKHKEVLMGDVEPLPFSLIAPVGTAVATERPQFRWEALPNAESYQVRVFDPEFRSVFESPKIQETEWIPTKALPSGITLTWQVAAQKQNEEIISPFTPFPDAKFYILKAEERQRIKQIQEKYSGFHLLLGVQLAEYGLLDDAEREFIALQQANPNSTEATLLLYNLRKLRKASDQD